MSADDEFNMLAERLRAVDERVARAKRDLPTLKQRLVETHRDLGRAVLLGADVAAAHEALTALERQKREAEAALEAAPQVRGEISEAIHEINDRKASERHRAKLQHREAMGKLHTQLRQVLPLPPGANDIARRKTVTKLNAIHREAKALNPLCGQEIRAEIVRLAPWFETTPEAA